MSADSERTWEDDIPGCFGDADGIFAGHPLDKERAKTLLTTARKEGVKYNRLSGAMVAYMLGEGCSVEHVEEQLKSISKMYEGKL